MHNKCNILQRKRNLNMREVRAILWIIALLVSSTNCQRGYVTLPKLINVAYLGNVVTYSGNMTITSSSDSTEAKNILFFISMVQNKHISCNYQFCFYGWICNYTVNGQSPVQGYPNGKNDIEMYFAFDTNNETDFLITRHVNSSQMFATLVDLFCRQSNPGLMRSTDFTKDQSNVSAVTGEKQSNLTLEGLQTKDTSKRENKLVYNQKEGMMDTHSDTSGVYLQENTLKNDKNDSVGFQKNCNMSLKRMDVGIRNETLVNKVRAQIQTMRILQGPACAWNMWRIDHMYEAKAKRNVDTEPNITIKAGQSPNATGRFGQNMTTSSQPLPTFSATLPNEPGSKSLLDMEKQIFKKNSLGKGINLYTGITVDANAAKNTVRLAIFLKYQIFGPLKQLTAFNNTVSPGVTLKVSYDFGGEWGFTFMIPLIPPLMGLSINLGIYLRFFVQVFAYMGCSYQPSTTHTIVSGGGGLSVGFAVEATASLQVLVIQLGVFITGTLVNLTVSINTRTILSNQINQYDLTVTIVLELRLFQFTWGFFLRLWFLLWGLRIVLVSWPIYNGVGWKWLLFKKAFSGAIK